MLGSEHKNWEGSHRVVGLRWTQNKSWEGSPMSTQQKKEIWEGSHRVVGSHSLLNKNFQGKLE